MDLFDVFSRVTWACSADTTRRSLALPGLYQGRVWASDGHTLAYLPTELTGEDPAVVPAYSRTGARLIEDAEAGWKQAYPVQAKAWRDVCREAQAGARVAYQADITAWKALPRHKRDKWNKPDRGSGVVVITREGELKVWTPEQERECLGLTPEARRKAKDAARAHWCALDAGKVLEVLKHAKPSFVRVQDYLTAVSFVGRQCNALLMPRKGWW